MTERSAELEQLGFARVGHWALDARYKSTDHLRHLHGIGFVLDLDMKDRFAGYRYGNPNKKDTDNRVKCAITDLLQEGDSVDIWGLEPEVDYPWGGTLLRVPLSKPIEEHLIRVWKPPHNNKALKR